jgi:hypothetical protein
VTADETRTDAESTYLPAAIALTDEERGHGREMGGIWLFHEVAVGRVVADRLREQEDRVRAALANIGHLKAAQSALMALGVDYRDAGRILSGVQYEYVELVHEAMGYPRHTPPAHLSNPPTQTPSGGDA